jgi:hypothetical protein
MTGFETDLGIRVLSLCMVILINLMLLTMYLTEEEELPLAFFTGVALSACGICVLMGVWWAVAAAAVMAVLGGIGAVGCWDPCSGTGAGQQLLELARCLRPVHEAAADGVE